MKTEFVYEMTGKEIKDYLETQFHELDQETKRLIATMLVHLEYHREFLEDKNLLDEFIGDHYQFEENDFEVH